MRYRIEVYDKHRHSLGRCLRGLTIEGTGNLFMFMQKRRARRVLHSDFGDAYFVTNRRGYVVFSEAN